MTIYEFIEMNNNEDVVYSVFDCNTGELVCIATEEAENALTLSRDDLLYSDYADYEICSMDMWVDNGKIHIEFNIEVDEEEF